jgi:hypothetical protein
MRIADSDKFERTDIWREGKWLDLWSVVHFLSGISVGLGLYFLHFGAFASTDFALLSFIAYEMWETVVHIEEDPTNKFMDVVVGMASFLPSFFLLAPELSHASLILTFGSVLVVNVVMSVFGWRASQKAAVLQNRMQAKYAAQRTQLLKHGARLRERFRR